jgi:hypothetical protein
MKGFALFCLIGLTALLTGSSDVQDRYVLFAWNDLGMHCSNKDFSNMCILPPYNNIMAQAIRVGDASRMPQIITNGIRITYEIPGNTYSVGKTNFWSYEDKIFGVTLNDNIGLTGKGLSGEMDAKQGYYIAEGVPITPYTDADLVNEDPYQQGLIKLYSGNVLLSSSKPVIPVSNEISCVSSGCHPNENHIINEHTDDGGFDRNDRPILCASCHSSNALGTPGKPGLGSLSQVIHEEHGSRTNDCYKCHPGAKTKCFRDVMYSAGKKCQDCHGSVSNVANTIENGRRPWLDEPKCGSTECHGNQYAENDGKLFRQSKGHGGLYCSACHGSPHAINPSTNDKDNENSIRLQGFAGPIRNCMICHGVNPTGSGPHGLKAPGPDSEAPSVTFKQNCSGLIEAVATDGPDDDFVRTNIASIELDAQNSFNFSFTISSFTPGMLSSVPFKLQAIDQSKDAFAIVKIKDLQGNIKTMEFEYLAKCFNIKPEYIDFGNKPAGQEVSKDVWIVNRSEKFPNVIAGVSLKNNTAGISLTTSPFPAKLSPAESLKVTITIGSEVNTDVSDSLIIRDTCGRTIAAYISAVKAGAPVIFVSDIEFRDLLPGTTGKKKFTITNHGSAELKITGVEGPSDPHFVLIMDPVSESNPLIIGKGLSYEAEVEFTPTESLKIYNDTIQFISNASMSKAFMILEGWAIEVSVFEGPEWTEYVSIKEGGKAGNTLSLDFKKDIGLIREISLCDSRGAMIQHFAFSEGLAESIFNINMASHSNGLYLIRIKTRDGSLSIKYMFLK